MSDHATVRSKQRGIPTLIIEWLEEYGSITYDHHGGRKIYFDKKSRKLLSKRYGKEVVDRMGSLMNTYIVEDNGCIITVAHRQKHITHN